MADEIVKLDRLDQIRAHLLDDKPISPTQEEMLSRYRATFAWMCKDKSPAKAIKKAETEFGYSYSQAARVVRDCIQLYGDVQEYSKEGLKNLMFERFINAGDRADKAGDFKAAERFWDKACKIKDLYNAKVMAVDIEKLLQFSIEYGTDPALLKEQQTIDISHDEA